jgi:hypothetical protein
VRDRRQSPTLAGAPLSPIVKGPMGAVYFLPVVALLVACATPAPFSYSEAIAKSRQQSQSAALKPWITATLAPFMQAHIGPAMQTCMIEFFTAKTNSLNCVFVLDDQGSIVKMFRDSQSIQCECLRENLVELSWPHPPVRELFVPVNINVQKGSPAAPSDDEIIDRVIVRPSN